MSADDDPEIIEQRTKALNLLADTLGIPKGGFIADSLNHWYDWRDIDLIKFAEKTFEVMTDGVDLEMLNVLAGNTIPRLTAGFGEGESDVS